MKTAGVFIDAVNQYYSVLSTHQGMRIDYAKYLENLSREYLIHRAFVFGAQMSNEADYFLTILQGMGFETRYRKAILDSTLRPDIRHTDRNMPLAMELWRIVEKLDVAIIGSNDPDLIPLVQRIKELGLQTVVYSCNLSKELKEVADKSIEVDVNILYRKGTDWA